MENENGNNKVTDLMPFWEERLTRLLLQMDGSTTLTLAALVGGNIEVQLKHQKIIKYQDLPEDIQSYFPGEGPFLHRVTSLKYQANFISDNAVFTDISLLSPELWKDLYLGKIPLGLLIANMEYRRQFFVNPQMKLDELGSLFSPINLPAEKSLVKKYVIIREQKCWFYICEIFHLKQLLLHFLA